jgi:hypothetical protein
VPGSLGRNDPCHCGSGKKYKACHLAADEAAQREQRAKAAEAAPAPEAPAESTGKSSPAHKHSAQPWKQKGGPNTRGFTKVAGTRKVGGGG